MTRRDLPARSTRRRFLRDIGLVTGGAVLSLAAQQAISASGPKHELDFPEMGPGKEVFPIEGSVIQGFASDFADREARFIHGLSGLRDIFAGLHDSHLSFEQFGFLPDHEVAVFATLGRVIQMSNETWKQALISEGFVRNGLIEVTPIELLSGEIYEWQVTSREVAPYCLARFPRCRQGGRELTYQFLPFFKRPYYFIR